MGRGLVGEHSYVFSLNSTAVSRTVLPWATDIMYASAAWFSLWGTDSKPSPRGTGKQVARCPSRVAGAALSGGVSPASSVCRGREGEDKSGRGRRDVLWGSRSRPAGSGKQKPEVPGLAGRGCGRRCGRGSRPPGLRGWTRAGVTTAHSGPGPGQSPRGGLPASGGTVAGDAGAAPTRVPPQSPPGGPGAHQNSRLAPTKPSRLRSGLSQLSSSSARQPSHSTGSPSSQASAAGARPAAPAPRRPASSAAAAATSSGAPPSSSARAPPGPAAQPPAAWPRAAGLAIFRGACRRGRARARAWAAGGRGRRREGGPCDVTGPRRGRLRGKWARPLPSWGRGCARNGAAGSVTPLSRLRRGRRTGCCRLLMWGSRYRGQNPLDVSREPGPALAHRGRGRLWGSPFRRGGPLRPGTLAGPAGRGLWDAGNTVTTEMLDGGGGRQRLGQARSLWPASCTRGAQAPPLRLGVALVGPPKAQRPGRGAPSSENPWGVGRAWLQSCCGLCHSRRGDKGGGGQRVLNPPGRPRCFG